jgi:hypothetical protein
MRNLFGITATATEMLPRTDQANALPYSGSYVYLFGGASASANIDPQYITIGSYGPLNTNGVLYTCLPDGADIDITPSLANIEYYQFGIGQAQKYHSYYDVFDDQANPGFSFYPVGVNDYGHSFWQFRTDAPADALQYISTNLIQFLGRRWGFYPISNPPPSLWNLETVAGFIQNDGPPTAHEYNICRTFYIGFANLINGLEFTKDLSNAPPQWSATGYNCVSAVRTAGFQADVFGLPSDCSPQNFGITLIGMYPGPGQVLGPFIDTTDIFYSSAPY